jgi:methanogenic corrinoid protein MtbC1
MTEFDTPLYSLKMVVKTTGLTAATLRAWERRYGLPSPRRSAGRHRLYSARDIETLRWLNARLAQGSRIRQAVDQWQAAFSGGRDPLAGLDEMKSALSPVFEPATLESLRDEWLQACKVFNEAVAEKALDRAFELFPVEQACIHVLQSGLRQIGEEWFNGQTSVQQEHFTSAQAIRRLESLFASSPQATRPQTVLVGCPAGEWHTFSALLLVLLLRRRGLHVIYLGADLPGEEMVDTVRQTDPDLVIFTAQTLTSTASLLPAARILQADGRRIAFGGWIFTYLSGLSNAIPGQYLGDDLEAAALQADRLASKPRSSEQTTALLPADNPLSQVLELFKQRRALVEIDVLKNPAITALELKRLWAVNLSLGSDLQAALELGSLDFLSVNLRWVSDLLSPMPDARLLLKQYLEAYRKALRERLGEPGRIVTEWDGWEVSSRDEGASGHAPADIAATALIE